MRHEIEARDANRLDEVTDLVTQAVAQHFGDDQIDGKIQAHIFTATA